MTFEDNSKRSKSKINALWESFTCTDMVRFESNFLTVRVRLHWSKKKTKAKKFKENFRFRFHLVWMGPPNILNKIEQESSVSVSCYQQFVLLCTLLVFVKSFLPMRNL